VATGKRAKHSSSGRAAGGLQRVRSRQCITCTLTLTGRVAYSPQRLYVSGEPKRSLRTWLIPLKSCHFDKLLVFVVSLFTLRSSPLRSPPPLLLPSTSYPNRPPCDSSLSLLSPSHHSLSLCVSLRVTTNQHFY